MLARYLFLACVIVCFLGCSQPEPPFNTLEDEQVSLASLKGRWIVINYWAAWCPSCRQEIQELNQFNLHKPTLVKLLAVNADHIAIPALRENVKQLGIQFSVLTTDPQQAWKLDEVPVIPVTFILSPTGKVVKKWMGPVTEGILTTLINQLMADEKN